MKPNNTITAQRLRELVNYNPETGVFTWKMIRRRCRPGKLAGCRMKHGYWCIRLDDILYTGHRLAWLYMTGAWPAEHIDHINGQRDDNRFCNLREATTAQNAQNSKRLRSTNTSGYTGVRKSGTKWTAEIKVMYKSMPLGVFDTAQEAHEAYQNMKAKVHPFSR